MNVALQIAEIAGTDRRDLSKLEALDEPERLSALRTTVADMLPDRVPFSEVLLEVCRWTGFADAFTHLSEGRARAKDLHIGVSCAPCGAYPERMKMVFGRPGRRRL